MAPSLEENTQVISEPQVLPIKDATNKLNYQVETINSIPQIENLSVQLSNFVLEDHPIDVRPRLKVAVIGAGLAGITAGILLPIKVPGIDLTIFDKNANVGGTWFENTYPGVRCDIPANVYQSTFTPNTQWTEEYAQGREILAYWQSVAAKYNVYQYLKLQHKLSSAVWDPTTGKWNLSLENLASHENFTEAFDVVITATGRFNAWKLPDYRGIADFKGHLRHSSNWDPSFDPKGKKIAVIGNGASGIQLVPNLQPLASHIDHYARSPTWIAGSFGGEGPGRRLEPNLYSPELLASFAADPETYYKFRKELESKFYQRFGTLFKDSESNTTMREEFIVLMAERLKAKPELLDEIVPDFSPNCRRLTPGPGYLEALTSPNVSFIRTPISHFTADSIVDTAGIERKIDAVICATGANIDLVPPFPIIAKGQDLRDVWKANGPLTYLGLGAPNFPNLLFISGPNSTGQAGTVPHQTETQITYISRLLRKVSGQSIKSFAPSQGAVDDFIEYADSFFEKTVLKENCSSWANGGVKGGRVYGHWPGSARHLDVVKRDPRWEDWEWEVKSESEGSGKSGKVNRFAWLGNGWTDREIKGEGDLTPYLRKPEEIDLRRYHEEWFEGIDK